ncbi:hypothetical protein AMECASPLE_010607 [Ameca splendens]|uniref:Secreted protein n=1 Tax=Ameca splendens TaxID=208324 RepID=A0ABV0ZYQ7_9TELE
MSGLARCAPSPVTRIVLCFYADVAVVSEGPPLLCAVLLHPGVEHSCPGAASQMTLCLYGCKLIPVCFNWIKNIQAGPKVKLVKSK